MHSLSTQQNTPPHPLVSHPVMDPKNNVRKPLLARMRDRIESSRRSGVIQYILLCGILCVVVLVVSIAIAGNLVLKDVDDRVPLVNGPAKQIDLVANFLDVDATARTATIDWFPLPPDCSAAELVVDLFIDPNLLADAGSDTASSDPPTTPIFHFNTSQYCHHRTNRDSFPTFRTALKLTGFGSSGLSNSRSLQAYPWDVYFFQVSMFAQESSTNDSVGIQLLKSFGIPTNFEINLNKNLSSNDADGILLNFTVKHSTAVIVLVVIILVANWLVTLAFLCITVASFMFNDQEIVTEMFVVPIATLFAFTAVRGNLPGAPEGFGAVIDYYGIVPNLGLMTFFSAILLLRVLYRRLADAAEKAQPRCECKACPSAVECKCKTQRHEPCVCDCSTCGIAPALASTDLESGPLMAGDGTTQSTAVDLDGPLAEQPIQLRPIFNQKDTSATRVADSQAPGGE